MVRELTELQGTMGGIYAREEGLPEEVWKAIYYHYLPVGVEADAPPTAQQLGAAAVTWAAVSLADKLDSVVGMFAAGERPTGSRDPLGLRRQAQGAVKILADLPELTGLDVRVTLEQLLDEAASALRRARDDAAAAAVCVHVGSAGYLLEQRGFDVRSVRAVLHGGVGGRRVRSRRGASSRRCRRWPGPPALLGVAALFKRVKNISKGVAAPQRRLADSTAALDGAGRTGAGGRDRGPRADHSRPPRRRATTSAAFATIAALQPAVAKFFDDVLVMAEDERLRAARLGLVATLRDLILGIADISEIVPRRSAVAECRVRRR